MVGNSVKFGVGNLDEQELYIPVKSRKNKHFKEKLDQKFQELNFVEKSRENNHVLDLGNQNGDCLIDGNLNLGSNSSNISRFLDATIPSVTAQYFSKTTMKGRTCDVEYQHYFSLGDLWESFRECSAYGAGVPLVLIGTPSDDEIVQYYVPYLSAIQLFGQSSKFNGKSSGGQSGDDDKLSSCDDTSDDEFEDGNYSTISEHFRIKADEAPSITLSSLSMQHQPQAGFCSDERDKESSQGELLFQFFEKESPYSREPLASKVGELASLYQALKTLRSCDLHPSSWMSVAWYPIYRIPSGSTLKDLDACFLTYHCLSTPLKGEGSQYSPKLTDSTAFDGTLRFSLPAFGLGVYRFKALIWTGKRESECSLVNSLTKSADHWLKQLQVNHPDLEFFLSRSLYQR